LLVDRSFTKGVYTDLSHRLKCDLFATVEVMTSRPSLSTDANRKALRALFLLYDVYKNTTLDHMDNPRSTSMELNALYRNKLVPKINELVTKLKVGPTSDRRYKLLFDPTPFKDLLSIAYEIRVSDYDADYFIANIGKVQSGTKDLLEMNQVTEDDGSLDDVQEIIAAINRLRLSNNSSGNLIQLGEKPVADSDGTSWFVVGGNGKKKLCKKGSIAGELLVVLLKSWGAERSYEAIFVDVNQKTSKQGWNQACIPNTMKRINKVVHAAGYRRLKVTDNGISCTLGFTDKAQ